MPDAPTILYLLDYTDLGGGETSFLALLEQLQREGAVRPVVALSGPGPLAGAIRELGVAVEILGWPRRLRRGPLPWFNPVAARRVGRLVDRTRPALIHAMHFFGMLYAGPAAHRRRLPLLWTCHGWFDVDRPAKRWVARRFADHVACVSEAVRAEATRYLTRPGMTSTDYLGIQPFSEISPGAPVSSPAEEAFIDAASSSVGPARAPVDRDTDLRATVRREEGIDPATPLVGVVGRFQPIKGHQYLLDALPAIRRCVPGLKVWFIGDALFGDEEDRHKEYLERRVREEGLSECVRFMGFRRDARRLMRALDALAIPSERESFSMVAAEGLEAGIPVVGPDCWGPREIIDAPATGLRFEPKNVEDLALKITQTLLREGDGAAFDPTAGPRRVAERFTVATHAHRTLERYRSLINASMQV